MVVVVDCVELNAIKVPSSAVQNSFIAWCHGAESLSQ
jgi:hypothetical protein